jgi:hypothetical protein
MRANHGHLQHKALILALGKACLLNSRAYLTVGMIAIPKKLLGGADQVLSYLGASLGSSPYRLWRWSEESEDEVRASGCDHGCRLYNFIYSSMMIIQPACSPKGDVMPLR